MHTNRLEEQNNLQDISNSLISPIQNFFEKYACIQNTPSDERTIDRQVDKTRRLQDPPIPLNSLKESIDVELHSGKLKSTINLEVPNGRNNFTPQLKLSYNSNSNDGEFGLGWNIDIPSIKL